MTAARNSSHSLAFVASIEQLRALALLAEQGESQTERGHELRLQLESLWQKLSSEEQDLVDALSTDLRTLVEQPPPGPEPTEGDLANFRQAISAKSWMVILSLLSECPRLSYGVDGALLRAECWRALGEDQVAAQFYAQASKLLGRTPIVIGVVAARRRELAQQRGVPRRSVRPLLLEHHA